MRASGAGDGGGAARPIRRRVRVRGGGGRRRHWHHRRWARRSLLVLGVVLAVAALDATWVVTTASRELRAARSGLERGAEDLSAGRLADAEASFVVARAAGERALGAMGHPTSALAGVLPWIGRDVRAVRALARASEIAADAGGALVRAAQAAGWDGSSIRGAAPGAPFPLDAVGRATPELDRAAQLLAGARTTLDTIVPSGLLGPVRDALDAARDALTSRERLARSAATLAGLLPGFLGGEGPRRYLVVVQNLSDPRGSGGYPGAYAVLGAVDGRISLEGFAPMWTLGTVPPVDAPTDVRARYARFGVLTHFIATTYSPDFPTSARLLMAMWAASGRAPLDGVIAVDSVWMSYVLGAIGPVQTPAWPEPITAANVSEIVDRDTFLTTSSARSDRLQGAVGEALWRSLLARSLPAVPFAAATARAARERHLQVYVTDPREEGLLQELGVAGQVELGPNPLMVAWDGISSSRAGYFAEKAVDYHASLHRDGSADVTVTLTLTNTAPTTPPSILLGTGAPGDLPLGHFTASANVYLPRGAEDIRISGDVLVRAVEHEFGHPVALEVLTAPAGTTVTARLSYRVPDAVTSTGDGFEYRLDVLPQPALRPVRFSVEIAPGPGTEVAATSAGMTLADGVVRFEEPVTSARVLWIRGRWVGGQR